MWFSGEIKNLKREESLWSACQIASMLLPCYSISPFPQCLLEQTCSSSATLCSWMPRLPLASAAPTGAAATGSPVESNRHCLGLSWAQRAQPAQPRAHRASRSPSPPTATAQCQGQLGQVPLPRLSSEPGWALPQKPLHTRDGLTTAQEQLPQTEQPSPACSQLLLTCTHCLASSCASLWHKCIRAGSLGVREKLKDSFSPL